MNPEPDQLVPIFIPALVVVLVQAENKKGSPLTRDEVLTIRDSSACIMMDIGVIQTLNDTRGYSDIDPENCWHDWQIARRDMGRKPDIDPGPRFSFVKSSDAAYQQAIQDAQDSIDQFRALLPSDGTARTNALIKTRLVHGHSSAFMWLNTTACVGNDFSAELFEVPDILANYTIGDRLVVAREHVLDWMVNDHGRLIGGFSLRFNRSQMSDSEKIQFDRLIGVTEYV